MLSWIQTHREYIELNGTCSSHDWQIFHLFQLVRLSFLQIWYANTNVYKTKANAASIWRPINCNIVNIVSPGMRLHHLSHYSFSSAACWATRYKYECRLFHSFCRRQKWHSHRVTPKTWRVLIWSTIYQMVLQKGFHGHKF